MIDHREVENVFDETHSVVRQCSQSCEMARQQVRRAEEVHESPIRGSHITVGRRGERPQAARSRHLTSCSSSRYLWLCLVAFSCLAEASDGDKLSVKLRRPSANLPDLTSSTSDEPIVAVVGQDAYISCVAYNLQNYTIIWRFTNDAHAPGLLAPDSDSGATTTVASVSSTTNDASPALDDADLGSIISAGRQIVSSDDRFAVIRSHNTWLLRIKNVRLADTGTYICQTNSEPKVRAIRILNVLKSHFSGSPSASEALKIEGASETSNPSLRGQHFSDINHNFTECCRSEYVFPRCQRLCTLEQLASRYNSINIVHECYSALPSITRCMVAGRNVTDCCQRRHVPARCNSMCGRSIDEASSMSIQDQTYCADYSASIMSCK